MLRDALRHPFAAALLITSLLLAGAMRFLPPLDPWSRQAPSIVVLGLVAYAASVAAICRWRPSPLQPVISDLDLPENDLPAQEQASQDFAKLVDGALRKLNKPAALSRCELVRRLPGTLWASRPQLSHHGGPGELTPLERAQALRQVLTAAIERLKPPGESIGVGAPQALQYHILHEEYVQRRSTKAIMTRHSIGEANFFRNRREAVSVLARHLLAQERLASRKQPQEDTVS